MRQGAITGYVDSMIPEGAVINVSGWAAAENAAGPAEQVVAIVGGTGVAQAKLTGERPDVLVDAFDEPALENSGFSLSIRTSSLECTAAASGLTVFGIADGAAAPLIFGGDSERLLGAAC